MTDNNIKYLKYLDEVLSYLINECHNYTSKYDDALTSIGGIDVFERIYSTNFEKFLSQGYDAYIYKNKTKLELDFALIYLRDDGYIFFDTFQNFQITYKGILKSTYGFETEYLDKIEEVNRKSRQQKNTFLLDVFKALAPLISFLLGLFSFWLIQGC